MSTERLMRETEVARRLGLSSATLRVWRANMRGPKFFRLGRAIRYAEADVQDWLRARQAAA